MTLKQLDPGTKFFVTDCYKIYQVEKDNRLYVLTYIHSNKLIQFRLNPNYSYELFQLSTEKEYLQTLISAI
jgi:hypothetical protein